MSCCTNTYNTCNSCGHSGHGDSKCYYPNDMGERSWKPKRKITSKDVKSCLHYIIDGFDCGDWVQPISEINSRNSGITNVSVDVSGMIITIVITLKYPGVFIGKKGSNINKIADKLKEFYPEHILQLTLNEHDIWR